MNIIVENRVWHYERGKIKRTLKA